MAVGHKKFFRIGTVGKPSGLKGGFWIAGRTEPLPERVDSVWVGHDPAKVSSYDIVVQQWRGGRLFLQCQQISSREDLEEIRGQIIWGCCDALDIDRSTEYLWQELISLPVVDEANLLVGILTKIYNVGASDIAVVEREDGKRVEVPLVAEFVDLSFLDPPECLRLTVALSVFDDLWYGGTSRTGDAASRKAVIDK